MTANNQKPFSDVVDRVVDELQASPVPPPPPELLEALIQAAKNAETDPLAFDLATTSHSEVQPLSRTINVRNRFMNKLLKSISVLAVCCAVVLVVSLTVAPTMRGNIAFAEVCAVIQKARTMVCTAKTNLPTRSMSDIKIMSLSPGRIRQEMGTQIMIQDLSAGKTLNLERTTKTATLVSIKGMPASKGMQQDWFESFKAIAKNPQAEDLGVKIQEGRESHGFCAKLANMTVTFWADAKSAEPVMIEIRQPFPDFANQGGKGEMTMEMVMTNFQFDVPLDESLFSLTPPKGYELREMNMNFSGGGEKDVVEFLRRYADLENGEYPDSLTTQSVILKVSLGGMKKMEWKSNSKTDMKTVQDEVAKVTAEASSLSGRMTTFLSENSGWKYAGKGVKMGDAKTPIFWYVPKDAKQSRVVYGDLSVKDVPTDQLPQEEKR